MRRRFPKLLVVSIAFLALLAGACGGGSSTDDSTDTTGSTDSTVVEVQKQQGGTIRLAAEQEPTGLNHLNTVDNAAWTQYLMQHVWSGVAYTNAAGEIVQNKDLIDSVELAETDPQTVVYKINKDANWTDDKPVSADDFIYTWTAQNGKEMSTEKDPDTGELLPKYDAAATTGYEDMKSVTGSDGGKTVTVVFDKPFADWESMFDYLVPAHAFIAAGKGDPAVGFNTGFKVETLDLKNVVSNGAFKMTEYVKGQSMTLEVNEKFNGKKPFADRILVPFITDGTQQPDALDNNEIDVMFPQAQLDLVKKTADIPGAQSEVGFGTFWEHLDFNFKNQFLKDKTVREAIALALNRTDIVTRLPGAFSSKAQVLNNRMYFPGAKSYEAHGAQKYGKLNIAGAKKKLEAAGYKAGSGGTYTKGGKKLSVRITWRDPNERRQQTAELVQQQLKLAGIDVQLAPQPNFNFLDEGNFDIALFGWTGGTVLSENTSIYVPDGGQNYGKYSNPKIKVLFDKANIDLDKASRAKTMNEIDRILWEDMATLPLFQVPEFLAWQSDVIGPSYNGYIGPTWNADSWGLKAAK